MSKPSYKVHKTTEAAAAILRQHSRSMQTRRLMLLLYLSDRATLLESGRPITFDEFVATDQGPALRQTRILFRKDCSNRFWSAHIKNPSTTTELLSQPGRKELSEFEYATISTVCERHQKHSTEDLVAYGCGLPEYDAPADTVEPISFRSVLSQEFDPDEVEQIESELDARAAIEELL